MKRFTLVLCSFIGLILILPATHAAITNNSESNYVRSGDVIGAIEVSIDLRPNTLSYHSNGDFVTCYITPTEGYSVHEIDSSSIFLETIPVIPDYVGIIDRDLDGVDELMVKFDRSDVLDILVDSPSYVDLTVIGCFDDGVTFFGVDTVHVM